MKKQKQTQATTSGRVASGYASLLVVLCLAAYANSLTGDFVWDDQFQVVRNETIRSFDNLPQAFNNSLWSFMYSEGGSGNSIYKRYYRPFHTVIYMLAYGIGGLSPFIYHFFNVLLHSAVTVVVFFLCMQIGLESLTAFMAAGLFAIHPVHTESVAWIAGVGDLACALFYFSGLYFFAANLKQRRTALLWGSALCFLGALFSKEVGITFPAAAALLFFGISHDVRPKLRNAVHLMLPFGIVLAVYAALRLYAIGLSVPPVIGAEASVFDWATLVVWVLGQYLRYAIVPFPLVAQHMVPLHLQDRMASTILFAGLIAACIGLLWMARRRIPNGLMWLAMFAAMLTPVLYFQGSGILFAERYLYIPSFAIVVLVATAGMRIHRKAGIIALASLMAVFFALTLRRNRDWQNDETLYRRTLQSEPAAVKLWNNMGLMYLDRGEDAPAREAFEQALKHVEDERFIQEVYEKYRIYLGLGIIAAREDRNTEAKGFLDKALEFEPAGDAAYTMLAGLLINHDKDYAKATVLLNKALQINPKSELTRDYLGVALVDQQQYEQAVASFREALRINPKYEPAKQHLEVALRLVKP